MSIAGPDSWEDLDFVRDEDPDGNAWDGLYEDLDAIRPKGPRAPIETRNHRRPIRLLRERDGWLCQICHHPFDDPAPTTPHPLSVQVDHRLARINGGTSKLENLHLAHALCNQMKGPLSLADARRWVRARLYIERCLEDAFPISEVCHNWQMPRRLSISEGRKVGIARRQRRKAEWLRSPAALAYARLRLLRLLRSRA